MRMQIDRYQIITNISPNRKMPIYIELKKIYYKILFTTVRIQNILVYALK